MFWVWIVLCGLVDFAMVCFGFDVGLLGLCCNMGFDFGFSLLTCFDWRFRCLLCLLVF